MQKHTKYSNNEIARMIQETGIRPSVQRVAILSYVANHGTHPTADEIFSAISEEYPTLSRTTVYNSLHTLHEASLLTELEIEGGNMRYDFSRQKPHGHFICLKCGKIFDVDTQGEVKMEEKPGFTVLSSSIFFKGLCPDCNDDAIHGNIRHTSIANN